MKTRKPRGRIDAQQQETPFFSKSGEQANVEAKAQEGFFQPKLTIGKPGDRFEQEADKAADAVVNRTRSGSGDLAAVRKKEKVQRQAEQEKDVMARFELQRQTEAEEESVQAQAEEEEEAVQTQAEEEEEAVQAQPEEQEESVQAQAEAEEELVQAQAEEEEEAVQTQAEEEEESVQAQAEEVEEAVQTQAEEEEEAVQAQPEEEEETQVKAKRELQLKGGEKEENEKVQAKSKVQRGSPAFAAKMKQQQGKGRPLPPKIRAEMEASFDADFSAVRIHTDEEAVQLSQMLGAQAFTHGNDIFFNEGKFDPDSSAGKHLLAHELTHTKQQRKK